MTASRLPRKRKRKLIERRFVAKVLSWLILLYIRLVVRTSRLHIQLAASAKPYTDGEKNAIFAFWHGRMMVMPPFCPAARQMYVMSSRHGDGQLMAQAMRRFGFAILHGSRSRYGSQAASNAVDKLRAGANFCITPDGPRGPHQVAAMGAATISRLANVPVVPVSFSAKRYKRMRSWDRFMAALPFGEIFLIIGEPIFSYAVDRDSDEEMRYRIETALNEITETADRHWHAPL